MTRSYGEDRYVNRNAFQMRMDAEKAEFSKMFKQRLGIAAFVFSGTILTVNLTAEGRYWAFIVTLGTLFLITGWELTTRCKVADEIERQFAFTYKVVFGSPPAIPLRRTLPRSRARSTR